MSKCFCHFCGFEVKDATARRAIETIETNVHTAIQEGMQAVDQALQDQQESVDQALQTQQENISAAMQAAQQNVETIVQTQQQTIENHKIHIAQNRERLTALEEGLSVKDLSDSVSLTWIVSGGGGVNLTGLRSETHFFKYIPALGIVTYNVSIYIKGKMAKDEITYFQQIGGPERIRDGSQTPLATIHRSEKARDVEGRYVSLTANDDGSIVGSGISIRANEAIDTGDEECRIILQGWHYATNDGMQEE